MVNDHEAWRDSMLGPAMSAIRAVRDLECGRVQAEAAGYRGDDCDELLELLVLRRWLILWVEQIDDALKAGDTGADAFDCLPHPIPPVARPLAERPSRD